MARLLKNPVKKRTLKGTKKGVRVVHVDPPTHGRIDRKIGKKGKIGGRKTKR